jgi:hypothetical protein
MHQTFLAAFLTYGFVIKVKLIPNKISQVKT